MATKKKNPENYPQPPFPAQEQNMPGVEAAMEPKADHGETTYQGRGRLQGRKALITGADSGIGKAVAIAFAREGADVCISYLNERDDAEDTAKWIRESGRKALLVPGDISEERHCRLLVEQAIAGLDGIDIIVNNAAHQATHQSLQDITVEEWDYTFRTNLHSMFYICRAAESHLRAGSSIINTSSINAYKPNPTLIPYAITKGAIQNFTATLAQLWAKRGIRVNCVAPGPIWTPLIPGSFDAATTSKFGKQSPMGRPGQPAELAPVFVMLATDEASYVSGATIAVTGGMPSI